MIYKYRFIPRLVHIAKTVNDKLSTSRTVVIRFFEWDSTVEGITAKVQTALNSDAPITLTVKEMKYWTQRPLEVSCMIRKFYFIFSS